MVSQRKVAMPKKTPQAVSATTRLPLVASEKTAIVTSRRVPENPASATYSFQICPVRTIQVLSVGVTAIFLVARRCRPSLARPAPAWFAQRILEPNAEGVSGPCRPVSKREPAMVGIIAGQPADGNPMMEDRKGL